VALTITNRAGTSENASDLSHATSPNADVGLGPSTLFLVLVEYDNSGGSGADPFSSLTDTDGHTWSEVYRTLNDPGAANAGCVGAVFYTYPTSVISTTDSITLTLGTNTTIKCFRLIEVTAAAGFQPVIAASNSATYSTTTPTITTDTVEVDEAVIGVSHLEHATTPTGDADTTNGSWTAQAGTAAGSGATGGSLVWQAKIQTTTASTQTYNPTHGTSHDGVIGWLRIRERVARNPWRMPYPQLLPH
jgi:hypothetical protein